MFFNLLYSHMKNLKFTVAIHFQSRPNYLFKITFIPSITFKCLNFECKCQTLTIFYWLELLLWSRCHLQMEIKANMLSFNFTKRGINPFPDNSYIMTLLLSLSASVEDNRVCTSLSFISSSHDDWNRNNSLENWWQIQHSHT